MVDPNALVFSGCPFFRWWEMKGYQNAGELEVDRGVALVRDILCPARRATGPLTITSWLARRENHELGAFVDVVPGPGSTMTIRGLYEWMRDNLFYGEVGFERDHVHVSLPGFGGDMQAWLELEEGRYTPDPDARAARVVVEAGLNSMGGMLLVAGIGAGLWRARKERKEA